MNRTKPILYLALFLLSSLNLIAQPDLEWALGHSSGGTADEQINDVFVDESGNTYSCGSFSGNLNIGATALTAGARTEAFVFKTDPNGNILWAKQSIGDNNANSTSIYVDKAGAVYVGGYHNHTTINWGSMSINAVNNEDFYLVKFNQSGTPIHITGAYVVSIADARVNSIAGIDDEIFVTGYVEGDPLSLPISESLTSNYGGKDVFLAKIDTAFSTFNWAKRHGGVTDDQGLDLTILGENVYITGTYGAATCTFFAAGPDYRLTNHIRNAGFIASFKRADGEVNWANSIGHSSNNVEPVAITGFDTTLYITGGFNDRIAFGKSPSTTGIIYKDTMITMGLEDIFVAQYSKDGYYRKSWREGGTGDDIVQDITSSYSCLGIYIVGSFQNTVSWSGTAAITATNTDLFISNYDITGDLKWVNQGNSINPGYATSIHCGDSIIAIGGSFSVSDVTLPTSPPTILSNSGGNDFLLAKLLCSSCNPSISCSGDIEATADMNCNYVTPDYSGSISATDGCGFGYSLEQSPIPGTILNPGISPIKFIITDYSGKKDSCSFNLTVKADVSPIIVSCGESLINESTLGEGNNKDDFSCVSFSTSGEDAYYQFTVGPGSNKVIISMDNVSDVNDSFINTFWLGATCPSIGSSCIEADSLNVGTGEFSNGVDYLTYVANGPATYYFVVDSKTDHIDSYDIRFNCLESLVEFDKSGCGTDLNNTGFTATTNATTTLDLVRCETAKICHELFVKNDNGSERLDSVRFTLGPCYTAINSILPASPPGDNGNYDPLGDWSGSFESSSNSIIWEFNHSSGNPWGDGVGSNYSCNSHEFCFDAEITANCVHNDSLSIIIEIADDRLPQSSSGIDIVQSNGFSLVNTSDPGFSYLSSIYCKSEMTAEAQITGTLGGNFVSSPAGLVFSDLARGIIDLDMSTSGTYDIRYTVGPCAEDSVVTIRIVTDDDPSFSYESISYCLGLDNPLPNVTGTMGGTYSAMPAGVVLSVTTGEIDLMAPTPPNTYQITYRTPGPECVSESMFELTINQTQDSSFSYEARSFCQSETTAEATITGTTGGTFSLLSGSSIISSGTGEIDLSSANPLITDYTIKYTTPGPNCATSDTFKIKIIDNEDPSFSYPTSTYCQKEDMPLPNFIAVNGGVFSSPPGFLTDSMTGKIDLLGSAVSTAFNVRYVTPGPICPDTAYFEITINEEEDASFSFEELEYCQGNIINPEPTSIAVNGGTFSSSTGLNFIDDETGKIDLMGSLSGINYDVTYTSPGPICPNESTVSLLINPEQDASFSYPTSTYCKNGSSSDAIVTGTQNGSFISTGNISLESLTSGKIDLNDSNPGTSSITYTTPGPECINSLTIFIDILEADDANFEFDIPKYCLGNSINPIPIKSDVLMDGTFSEIANNLTFVDLTSGEINSSFAAPGVYNIEYVTNGSCPSTETRIFEFLPALNPDFILEDTICLPSNNIPLLAIPSTNPLKTSNFYSVGSTGFAELTSNSPQSLRPTATGPGSYTIRHVFEVENNSSCKDSSTQEVVILPEYNAEFIINDSLCGTEGNAFSLNALFTVATTSGGVWEGTAVFSNSFWDLTELSGNNKISYTVGEGRCAVSTDKMVYILKDVDSLWTSIPKLCIDNEMIDLTEQVSGTTGGFFSGIGVEDNTFIPEIAGLGIHNITYNVGVSPCRKSLTQPIEVIGILDFDVGNDQEFCGLSGSLSGINQADAKNKWFTTNPELSIETDPSLPFVEIGSSVYGSFYFSMESELDNVCSKKDSVMVTFWEQPIANAGDDQLLDFTFETNLNALVANSGDGIWSKTNGSIIWDISDSKSLVSELPTGSSIFYWTVSNGNCIDSVDTVKIIVNKLFIPEAITPNGDGKNDRLVINGIDQFEHSIEIFNRWGQLVYKSTDYNNDWSGLDDQGNLLTNDTYFYFIKMGADIEENGFLVLKR